MINLYLFQIRRNGYFGGMFACYEETEEEAWKAFNKLYRKGPKELRLHEQDEVVLKTRPATEKEIERL